MTIDATDRRIIAATAGGLLLVPRPFAEVAHWLGLAEAEVLARFRPLRRLASSAGSPSRPTIMRLGFSPTG